MCARGLDPQVADFYARQIEQAARRGLKPMSAINARMQRGLSAVYRRVLPTRGKPPANHPGLSVITLQRLQPRLRTILDQRLFESTRLVERNRIKALEAVRDRFTGWASSIPPQGAPESAGKEAKRAIRKELGNLQYAERRVLVDQSHKLRSNFDDLLALEGGAIAQMWHSHFRQAGYHYRPEHKERDQRIYLIRGSWALERGLIKADPRLEAGGQYTDQITRPGEEIFCRCWTTSLYALRDLPSDMLTEKGRAELARVRAA